jgi:DNA N-6-adenine-methyltransferase (Dam)
MGKKYHEAAVGESSEWRTPAYIFDALGLEFDLDPCAPEDGFCCVPAKQIYTRRDNGLLLPWRGLLFANPPWSEKRRAVVPWLLRFFAHEGGGIFLCVARTSADWFQNVALAHAELLCFPATKTRFHKPDGSLGPEPTNGICLIAKGEIACEALRRSGLGYCLTVDRTAAPSVQDQLTLLGPSDAANPQRL